MVSDNTSKCPACAGQDPYRESDMVMVSGPGPNRAVRMREAWRAFWRHRGEEISAAWGWLPEGLRDAISVACTMAAVLGFAGALIFGVGKWLDRDCNAACSTAGCKGVSKGWTCYCIVYGAPVPWHRMGEP